MVSTLGTLAIVAKFESFYSAFGYVCWTQLEMGDPVLLKVSIACLRVIVVA